MDDYDYDYMSFNYDYPDVSGFDPSSFNFSDINFSPSEDSFSGFSADSSGYLSDLGEALSFGDVLKTFDQDLGDLVSTFQSQDIEPYAEFDVDTARDFGFDMSGYSDAEAQEGGFYGNTPNATYDPKTNLTTLRDPDGSTRVIQGPPGPGTTNTNPIKQFIDRVTGPGANKKDASLLALLGGLMGLLGKKSGVNKGPVGYKGDIPNYTSVRGPTTSPTAGGRRPGGAGIGSLAGTTRYVPAAAA